MSVARRRGLQGHAEQFLRLLTRAPTAQERKTYTAYLQDGYDRRIKTPARAARPKRLPAPYVSWSNHLDGAATLVRQRQEEAARKGDPPTTRLETSSTSAAPGRSAPRSDSGPAPKGPPA